MNHQLVRIDWPAEQTGSNFPSELVPILCIKHPPALCINVGDALEDALRVAGWDKQFTAPNKP